MATPLRFDMILPNGEPLRWDTPVARWGGTVEEVMAAINQQNNKSMNTNKISAVLAPVDRDAAIEHLQSIKTLFPFLQGLTAEQKKRIKRAGDTHLPFIQKAYTYAAQHPEVLPGTFSLPEFAKDIAFFERLRPLPRLPPGLPRSLRGNQCPRRVRRLRGSPRRL